VARHKKSLTPPPVPRKRRVVRRPRPLPEGAPWKRGARFAVVDNVRGTIIAQCLTRTWANAVAQET
jgi:hypothetical protein